MPSEKELFVTKQYVPVGHPISQNNHTIIYKVKCMAEKGTPDGVLKMYRGRNLTNIYTNLMRLNYSEWPHIYNVKFFDGNTLVVEQFLEGHTLAELIQENKKGGSHFTEKQAQNIMDKLCDSINVLAHMQPPIIHHDLKPSNIFVTEGGSVKLLDFVPGETQKNRQSRSLLELLGSIFHEMLTGKPPKNGKCTYEGRYEPVIRKCLEKDPAKQYTNIEELQESIDYASTHDPTPGELGVAGIPYVLTFPFQGTILSFEWILLTLFFLKDNTPSLVLFAVIFAVHSVCFLLRRQMFLKKNNIRVTNTRKIFPPLALVGIFALLSAAVYFIF